MDIFIYICFNLFIKVVREGYKSFGRIGIVAGARGGIWTPTGVTPLDPKSSASANSATLAKKWWAVQGSNLWHPD